MAGWLEAGRIGLPTIYFLSSSSMIVRNAESKQGSRRRYKYQLAVLFPIVVDSKMRFVNCKEFQCILFRPRMSPIGSIRSFSPR